MELRLSGSGPAELAELSAGEDDELESEPVSKSLMRLGSRRTSSTKRTELGGLGCRERVLPSSSLSWVLQVGVQRALTRRTACGIS